MIYDKQFDLKYERKAIAWHALQTRASMVLRDYEDFLIPPSIKVSKTDFLTPEVIQIIKDKWLKTGFFSDISYPVKTSS